MEFVLGAHGGKEGAGAELIQVMVDGADAHRANVGEEGAAVEGAEPVDEAGKDAKVIHPAHQPYYKPQQECGDVAKEARQLIHVVVGVILQILVHQLVHCIYNVGKGGCGGKFRLNVGFHVAVLTLYHQRKAYGVAGIYLIPHDKAVKIRLYGNHPYKRRNDNVHKGKIRHIFTVLTDKFFDIFYWNILLKKILRIHAGAHNEGYNVKYGVYVSYPPAVIAVSKALFKSILHISSCF